ncbi:MAG TPA: hypothetical protein VNL71_00635 [Chloroflexota bacterium]|nr:hypothetical protein [Chloroflexota bacterium]
MNDFLTGGARLVWLLFPRTRTVQIYQSDHSTRMVSGEARLDGGDVPPGFSAALSSLFP